MRQSQFRLSNLVKPTMIPNSTIHGLHAILCSFLVGNLGLEFVFTPMLGSGHVSVGNLDDF
jgi:hypothetical protein